MIVLEFILVIALFSLCAFIIWVFWTDQGYFDYHKQRQNIDDQIRIKEHMAKIATLENDLITEIDNFKNSDKLFQFNFQQYNDNSKKTLNKIFGIQLELAQKQLEVYNIIKNDSCPYCGEKFQFWYYSGDILFTQPDFLQCNYIECRNCGFIDLDQYKKVTVFRKNHA